ncbi:MAG: hypothetical protein K6G12_10215 [Lachnospiraceae bacterium]|nr:hypothetical protein [Lachnospiraceae bacterium]
MLNLNDSKIKYNIIAVDFDGTLCDECFPHIGEPNLPLIYALLEQQRNGNKLILWTCRCGDRLMEAIDWCALQGLFFDAVNENLPEIIDMYGSDSRKITADLYIDDKSALPALLS